MKNIHKDTNDKTKLEVRTYRMMRSADPRYEQSQDNHRKVTFSKVFLPRKSKTSVERGPEWEREGREEGRKTKRI